MSRTKQAIAAKMLDGAWKHLCQYGCSNVRAAQDIISEAERLVRNGFKAWPNKEWNNQIQTVFTLWPDTKG